MAFQGGALLAGFGVPDADRAALQRQEEPAVSGRRDRRDATQPVRERLEPDGYGLSGLGRSRGCRRRAAGDRKSVV